MTFLQLSFLLVSLSWVAVDGRAVNISTMWFLPQEGFPVFYRYFKDKVTWNEANAICEFHHGELVMVENSSQMDAARAYLKELDVIDSIWIGLMRDSIEKSFLWMDGEKLAGDGYWLHPIPKSDGQLCAALDPAADFRWISYRCGGSQVASFVCQLPVPDWASKEDGCMLTSIPSLTVTLVPEMAMVELFSDCGLDGTRRITCKGGVNHEEMIRRLSCDEDAFTSTSFGRSTTDLMKETETQWENTSGHDGSVETTRGWSGDPYEPQTRHRRDTNPSSPGTTQTTLGEEVGARFVVDVTNGISDAGLRLVNVTADAITETLTAASETGSAHLPSVTIVLPIKQQITEKAIGPEVVKNAPVNVTERSSRSSDQDGKSVLIRGETLTNSDVVQNASATNGSQLTSESGELVGVAGGKTGSNESYFFSLTDDIIVNENPSFSPGEAIDVGVAVGKQPSYGLTSVEVTRLTTLVTGSALLPEHTSKDDLPSTMTPGKLTPHRLTPFESNPEKYIENVGELEEEKGDEAEAPQRPTRGRLFTHFNHPSFYPYFLNRVLG